MNRHAGVLIAKAGALYFGLVFGAGFLLGPVRLEFVAPRLGARMAELIEAPVMFVVILASSRWVIRRLAAPFAMGIRLGIGCLALGLMLAAECTLVLWLRGQSIGDYLATRDPVSGTVYYVMLGVFAAMPSLVARWTP